jgi:hypothetical protein
MNHQGISMGLRLGFACSAFAVAAVAQVLQTNDAIRWVPGVTVGVRGGVPVRTNLIDVTLPPFNANKTGTADATPAIQAAINAAPPDSVVYLPNGTYIIDTALLLNKSHLTLRGQSRGGAVLIKTNGYNGIVNVGGSQLTYGTRIAIRSGFFRGSTNATLASSSEASVGDVVGVSMLNPVHPTFKVISVAGYERLISQRAVITGIDNGTNISFSPPLIFDYTNNPVMFSVGKGSLNPMFASKHRIGVENLTLSQTNRANGMKGWGINMLSVANAANCWVTGVTVEWPKNYAIAVSDVAHFYSAHNSVANSQSPTPSSNNAGLLSSALSGGLFENNVFANRLFPAIEFNGGFSGNALFGNFFTNNVLDVDCHNAHPLMNLWEANNLDNSFEMDGYFGSASHQILWRNAIQSTWIPVLFKRWTTYMQVAGNVLGRAGTTYSAYVQDVNGQGSQIIELGRPNIGNHNYVGSTPPQSWNWPGNTYEYGTRANGVFTFTSDQSNTTNLVGDFSYVPAPVGSIYPIIFQDGSDTNRYYTSLNGQVVVSVGAGTSSSLQVSTPVSVKAGDRLFIGGQTAYQQLQKDDAATHLIHGNYDFFNHAITWSTNIASTNVETSILYPLNRPSWWGTNRWPAIAPELAPMIGVLPAQVRFLTGSSAVPPAAPRALRIAP